MGAVATPQPDDESNRALVAALHPPDWRNPDPGAGRYNLVVIGAGTAGLVTASVAAGLGARVALIESKLMGGDCLNVGCVPSKAVIRSGRLAAEARAAEALGLAPKPAQHADFAAAMKRMRRIRAEIAPHDSALRYRDELGVDVFLGPARFAGRDSIEVGGARLRFARGVIATGARASAPPVPGLHEAGFLTNETVFSLTEAPRRLAVIGGGPIGCELAQAFQRLGSRVTVLEVAPQILIREDCEAAEIVAKALRNDGVVLRTDALIEAVETGAGEKTIRLAGGDALRVDEILVAAGRAPNVEELGLEAAGVAFDPLRGVGVDDRLRTSNRRIYAVGDCAMEWKFTHAADAAAKLVVQNALFFGRKKLAVLDMPWCTYTDPEVAHIGLYEHEASTRGVAVDVHRVELASNDRARCDGAEQGFVKILTHRGRDEIVGATVVANHAGDLIATLSVAMAGKVGLARIAGAIFPYPTQAEAIKSAANQYMRSRLTPTLRRVFERFLAWRR